MTVPVDQHHPNAKQELGEHWQGGTSVVCFLRLQLQLLVNVGRRLRPNLDSALSSEHYKGRVGTAGADGEGWGGHCVLGGGVVVRCGVAVVRCGVMAPLRCESSLVARSLLRSSRRGDRTRSCGHRAGQLRGGLCKGQGAKAVQRK